MATVCGNSWLGWGCITGTCTLACVYVCWGILLVSCLPTLCITDLFRAFWVCLVLFTLSCIVHQIVLAQYNSCPLVHAEVVHHVYCELNFLWLWNCIVWLQMLYWFLHVIFQWCYYVALYWAYPKPVLVTGLYELESHPQMVSTVTGSVWWTIWILEIVTVWCCSSFLSGNARLFHSGS